MSDVVVTVRLRFKGMQDYFTPVNEIYGGPRKVPDLIQSIERAINLDIVKHVGGMTAQQADCLAKCSGKTLTEVVQLLVNDDPEFNEERKKYDCLSLRGK